MFQPDVLNEKTDNLDERTSNQNDPLMISFDHNQVVDQVCDISDFFHDFVSTFLKDIFIVLLLHLSICLMHWIVVSEHWYGLAGYDVTVTISGYGYQ